MEKGVSSELPDEEFPPDQHGDQAKDQIDLGAAGNCLRNELIQEDCHARDDDSLHCLGQRTSKADLGPLIVVVHTWNLAQI